MAAAEAAFETPLRREAAARGRSTARLPVERPAGRGRRASLAAALRGDLAAARRSLATPALITPGAARAHRRARPGRRSSPRTPTELAVDPTMPPGCSARSSWPPATPASSPTARVPPEEIVVAPARRHPHPLAEDLPMTPTSPPPAPDRRDARERRLARADPPAPHPPAAATAACSSPSSCCSSSARWPRCTCPASTPTSSTTASPRATPATSVRTGGVMLAVTAGADRSARSAAVYFGARTAMGFGRDVRAALFHRVGDVLRAARSTSFGAPSLITRTTNDVQQVQMLVLMTCTMLVAAPIMCVGGIVMALREDVGLSWLLLVSVPVLLLVDRLRDHRRMVPAVPADAGPHRRGQPGAARADHRHPGGPRLRPRAARDRAVRRGQRRPHRRRAAGRPAGWR